MAEGTGLEPASDKCAVVFGTTALPVRLTLPESPDCLDWQGGRTRTYEVVGRLIYSQVLLLLSHTREMEFRFQISRARFQV